MENQNLIAEGRTLRLATQGDIADMALLIALSARRLQVRHYSTAQIEAALGPVFSVDRQLILDGTYFVVREPSRIAGCGGWSRRRSLFGGDAERPAPDPELDPRKDAARIRAFFVHPECARRGVGREILMTCESAIRSAGFERIELVATL